MKEFKNLKPNEQKEIVLLFASWLEPYTTEVIKRVLEKKDEIINNETAMMMIRELKEREEESFKRFTKSLGYMFEYRDDVWDYDPHLNVLEHPKSYRDVLYDMYIK